MPVKKDADGKRWVEMETLIPGTPEQVWQSMCTGPGMGTWFTRVTVEEHLGGKVSFDLGGSVSNAVVTAWQPPKQFGYLESEWMPGAPPIATELTISARNDGKCLVRLVHSLFASKEDWDDQLESFEGGWAGFFDVLRVYQANFAGLKAAQFSMMLPARGEALEVWKRIVTSAGLEGANVGERHKSSGGPQPLDGTVEKTMQDARQRFVMLRLDAPFKGITSVGTYVGGDGVVMASAWTWVYGDDAETLAGKHEPQWRQWLEKMAG